MIDELKNYGKLFATLAALSLAFTLYKSQPVLTPLLLLTATYLTILIPGYLLNYLLYPKKMAFEERFTQSLAFGFVLLATVVLYTNALGLRITLVSASLLLGAVYALLLFGINRVHE